MEDPELEKGLTRIRNDIGYGVQMKTNAILLFAAVLAATLPGCGGPSAGTTPEETAESYAELRLGQLEEEEKRNLLEKGRMRMDQQEQALELWADRGQIRAGLDVGTAGLEFIEDNWSDIGDINYDIIKILDVEKTIRRVTIKFHMRYPERKQKRPKEWYLAHRSKEETLTVSLIEGVWRITGINRGGDWR